jgi:Fur family transcriptional regulator, ferric uptake regulator
VPVIELDPGLQEEVTRRLARAGQRWTGGRRHVVAAFARSTSPLSVSDVHDMVAPEVPLSSLYRILGDLVAAGVLIRLEFAEGFARFELDEGLAEHHHHLVCTGCGIVADLELPDLERTLGDTAVDIRRRAGFEARTHRLDFFGLCASCS